MGEEVKQSSMGNAQWSIANNERHSEAILDN
jgi:hypothetical protein